MTSLRHLYIDGMFEDTRDRLKHHAEHPAVKRALSFVQDAENVLKAAVEEETAQLKVPREGTILVHGPKGLGGGDEMYRVRITQITKLHVVTQEGSKEYKYRRVGGWRISPASSSMGYRGSYLDAKELEALNKKQETTKKKAEENRDAAAVAKKDGSTAGKRRKDSTNT
jgi:hypothetical protein